MGRPTVSMKRPNVRITLETLYEWPNDAVYTILRDTESGAMRQDYFTASDVVSYCKWRADKSVGEDQFQSSLQDQFPWWGYQGWSRLTITDKPTGWDLLGVVRVYLVRERTDLENFNFGRGHISGMRFRRKGTGPSQAEQATVEKKQRPKPVHYFRPNKGYGSNWKPLCTEDRYKPSRGYRHTSRRSNAQVTSEPDRVTCPRCLKKMEERPSEPTEPTDG